MAARIERDVYTREDEEDDPYSAPTKVGPLARASVQQLFASTDEPKPKSKRPISQAVPVSTREPDHVPRLFTDEDELDPGELFLGYRPQSGQTVLLSLPSMLVASRAP